MELRTRTPDPHTAQTESGYPGSHRFVTADRESPYLARIFSLVPSWLTTAHIGSSRLLCDHCVTSHFGEWALRPGLDSR
jgi:hypothetical protein